jgi:Endomembrane protein 70
VYALTTAVAGYSSGAYYRQYFTTPRAEASSQWQKTMLLTVVLLPTIVVSVLAILNTVRVIVCIVHHAPPLVQVDRILRCIALL